MVRLTRNGPRNGCGKFRDYVEFRIRGFGFRIWGLGYTRLRIRGQGLRI